MLTYLDLISFMLIFFAEHKDVLFERRLRHFLRLLIEYSYIYSSNSFAAHCERAHKTCILKNMAGCNGKSTVCTHNRTEIKK